LYRAILVIDQPAAPKLAGPIAREAAVPGPTEWARTVKQFKFKALISLDAAKGDVHARQYPSGTHCLMVRCTHLSQPAHRRYFPVVIYRDDEQPLRPGDRGTVVTIEVADDDADAFLGPGQHVTLWDGSDVGHGVISRRVFFTWGAG
jgi:hypothetical protein